MGPRKLLVPILLTLITTCYANEEIFISNCTLTEDRLIVEIDLRDVIIYRITRVRIDYKNISKSILFEPEEITYEKTDFKIVINLDLKNKILYTNEEAKLIIQISGGFVTSEIFISDPISNIDPYYFPSNAYDRVRIIILKQYYIYRY